MRSVRLAAVLGVLAALPAAPAAAHPRLVGSDPGDSAVLSHAPRTVTLRFSEPLALPLTSARVLGPDGRAVAGVRVRLQGATLTLSLPALGRGAYSTLWSAAGSQDPHRIRGALVFRAGPGPRPAPAAGSREAPPPAAVAVRWLDFAALAAAIGALAVVVVVLRPVRPGAPAAMVAAARRAEARLLGLAATAAGAALVLGVPALPPHALSVIAWEPETSLQLLGETRWGRLWLARELLLVLLAVALVRARRAARVDGSRSRTSQARGAWGRAPGAALAAAGLAVAGLVTLRALGGHAAEVEAQPELSVVALALHIVAAAVWIGGVGSLAVGFWPLLRADERPATRALLRAAWAPFGRLAAAAVAVLAITGLYTAGRQVASVDALLATLYGWSLVAKLGLVGAVGGLGLLSAVALRRATAGLQRLRLTVLAEAGVGVVLLLVAALMSSAAPARGPEFAPAVPAPAALSANRGDTLVTLAAAPNRPGANVFTATVGSARRPDPSPPIGVAISFGSRPPVAMRRTGPGRYLLAGDQLSAAGRSRIAVFVRRRGEEDRVVTFAWRTRASARPVVVSDRPLEPPLTTAAALLALAVAGLAAFAARPPRVRGTAAPVRLDAPGSPS
jgi:copper transport protein